MTTTTQQLAPNNAAQAAPVQAACTECDARIAANVALPGEILDCPDCGAELEVRSVSPLVLALAPSVEEDWGE
jgi:alpha-aminoadipate carrier protein LysW